MCRYILYVCYLNIKKQPHVIKAVIAKIRKIIVDSGALAYSEELIRRFLAEAKQDLKEIRIKSDQKKFLLELVGYLEKRTK